MSELSDIGSNQNVEISSIIEALQKNQTNASNIRQNINSRSSSSSVKETSSSSQQVFIEFKSQVAFSGFSEKIMGFNFN